MAPAAGCPAEEIFCHLRDGAVPRRPGGPTGSAPPGAAPAAWPQEPQLASAIPFQVSQGAVGRHSHHQGEKVPPRRPKRRPRPKASAIQRSPRGRYLLLLSFRLGQRPVIHRAHPSAPSGRAADALGHTTSEAHYQRQASLIASLVRAMNPPRPRLLGLQGCSKDHATRTAQDMGQVH